MSILVERVFLHMFRLWFPFLQQISRENAGRKRLDNTEDGFLSQNLNLHGMSGKTF